MLIVTAILTIGISLILILLMLKMRKPHDKLIIQLLYYTLWAISAILIISEFSGFSWNEYIRTSAVLYIGVYWLWQTLRSSFWGLLFFGTIFIVHMFIGGFIYAIYEIPYDQSPFSEISMNRPQPLPVDDFPDVLITGVPLNPGVSWQWTANAPEDHRPGAESVALKQSKHSTIKWRELEPLIARDSHVRTVLHQLKEKQDQALSEHLANLNSISVAGTNMHRHALTNNKINELLTEKAISKTRYHTLIETWRLLDHDERQFNDKQAEQRFHVLLELLEDTKVDETNKVELIRFLVRRFPDDARLVKPLINLYDHLDSEYPRHKRLNQDFMALYLNKRNAVLEGFATLGDNALQPLLDYRKKTISKITYSQAKLDAFIERVFATKIRPLYRVDEARSIPHFLNRRKYPPLKKLQGASFEQDYIRRNLLQLAEENAAPDFGSPVLGLAVENYQKIHAVLRQAYSDQIDYWVIDPDPVLRANLAWVLAEIKNPYTLPIIFELMKDTDPEVRRIAAIAVGNFRIMDIQGSHDQKFIEIVKMLQNYRSNSDAFGRTWAIFALSNIGDKQKALYIIDLILNDGSSSNSILGDAAPTWRSDAEKQAVQSLVKILQTTPEELSVKTQALNVLIAIESAESFDILLHYLHHIYQTHETAPMMWRYIVPHLTLPQEAENVEDIIFYLAGKKAAGYQDENKRYLKAQRRHLRRAYEGKYSGEFFELLRYLSAFDHDEYEKFVDDNQEQIRIMRMHEYIHATLPVWIALWPFCIVTLVLLNYLVLPRFDLDILTINKRQPPNRRANPATDRNFQTVAPPSAILPVKIAQKS